MYNLGEIVKDKVSGFTGIIMAKTYYATGCIQYALAKQKLKDDGTISNWEWIDEIRLEPTGEEAFTCFQNRTTIHNPGGPQQVPKYK